jgi:sugar lactone lactonase YvrE
MKLLKASALISLAIINCSIVSCDTANPQRAIVLPDADTRQTAGKVHIIDLGAGKVVTNNKITVKIEPGQFTTKASRNGDPNPDTSQDIQSYIIYLIQHDFAPPFTPGGDPLNATKIVAGPFTINADARVSETIDFINITNTASKFYYAAVRAFSGPGASGVDLIKKDNGDTGNPWTGTTALSPAFGHVAVSTTAVQVDASNKVSAPNNILKVIPKLNDAFGTAVESKIVFAGPYSLVRSYEIDLTTGATTPFLSRVIAFGSPLDSSIQPAYKLIVNNETTTINNIPVGGPYFATVAAFSGPNGTGVNLTQKNNGGTPYASTDANRQVAVSTNSVSVSGSQTLSFSNFNYLSTVVNLETNLLNTIAGSGVTCSPVTGACGDGAAATAADLFTPNNNVAFDDSGNIYFADSATNRVRKIDAKTGFISTVAGSGNACTPSTSPCGDGNPATATTAKLNSPGGIAIAKNGDIYISDTGDHRIRKVSKSSGNITTVAGTGNVGFAGGGSPAITANLNGPQGIAIDNNANIIYIADANNQVVRVFTDGGLIDTFAGIPNSSGFSGDGLLATLATLNAPNGVAVDSSGDVYIADTSNNAIRKVSSGFINRVAGLVGPSPGNSGYSGDGFQATSARLFTPVSVSVAKNGDFYIADTTNDVIRKVDISGKITTVAGDRNSPCFTPTAACGDLSKATVANLKSPRGVAADDFGNIYITDTGTNKIRKVFVND